MQALFYVNATVELGTGHLFRCISLAHSFRLSGCEVNFMGHIESFELVQTIHNMGFGYIQFELNAHSASSRNAARIDINSVTEADIIVVDDPSLDAAIEKEIFLKAKKLVLIVDRPIRKYLAHVIISPNLFHAVNPFEGHVENGVDCYVGPSYMPLRPEFYFSNINNPRTGNVRTIGSFFGGSDPGNQTERVLRLSSLPGFENIEFRVIAGPLHNSLNELRELSKNLKNVHLFRSTKDIPYFLDSCDLFIGSFGTSAWERCFMGLPTVASIQSADQLEDAEVLTEIGAVVNVGPSNQVSARDLRDVVWDLISYPEKVKMIGESSKMVMEKNQLNSQVMIANLLR